MQRKCAMEIGKNVVTLSNKKHNNKKMCGKNVE